MDAQSSPEEMARAAQTAAEGLLDAMGFPATVHASVLPEGGAQVRVESDEAAELVGEAGEGLEAFQYLLNRHLRRAAGPDAFCVVDIGGWRAQRAEVMAREARDIAARVRASGRPFTFPPLSPSDRRAVHRALADETDVETVSHDPANARGEKRLSVRLKSDAPNPA
ncbi:MAG: hypothetical protein KBA51_08520 [Kiritimatiellae bacterium]|nr:hypothetical protein [Kiritimatiellia bacterium]